MEPVYEPFLMILKLKTDQESLGKIVANEIFLITVHAWWFSVGIWVGEQDTTNFNRLHSMYSFSKNSAT